MNGDFVSWETAVAWLKTQPDQQELVLNCYYDDPLVESARRFAESEEWHAVRSLLPRVGLALDLGAGRGISSYALTTDGWQVIALEPDSSSIVGAEAIRRLAAETQLPIAVVEDYTEDLSFKDATFDLVYGRQVLHHARDLKQFCREVFRVLKPGGRLIATREHVISQQSDLQIFRSQHPLHRLYGGESAYLLGNYVEAITECGLRMINQLGPFDSAINYYPLTTKQWHTICIDRVARFTGRPLASRVMDERSVIGRLVLHGISRMASRRSNTPGRLFSFVAEKPLHE